MRPWNPYVDARLLDQLAMYLQLLVEIKKDFMRKYITLTGVMPAAIGVILVVWQDVVPFDHRIDWLIDYLCGNVGLLYTIVHWCELLWYIPVKSLNVATSLAVVWFWICPRRPPQLLEWSAGTKIFRSMSAWPVKRSWDLVSLDIEYICIFNHRPIYPKLSTPDT